jgi:hypothetical protein
MILSPNQFEALCAAAWDAVCASGPAPILWPVMKQLAEKEELRRLGLAKFQDMVSAILDEEFDVAKSFWIGSGKRLRLADVPDKTVANHKALVDCVRRWTQANVNH